jgi:hypothetical protein
MHVMRQQLLWLSGPFRCLHGRARFAGELFRVVVYHGDQVICEERCSDPEEASKLGDRFWQAFVETC